MGDVTSRESNGPYLTGSSTLSLAPTAPGANSRSVSGWRPRVPRVQPRPRTRRWAPSGARRCVSWTGQGRPGLAKLAGSYSRSSHVGQRGAAAPVPAPSEPAASSTTYPGRRGCWSGRPRWASTAALRHNLAAVTQVHLQTSVKPRGCAPLQWHSPTGGFSPLGMKGRSGTSGIRARRDLRATGRASGSVRAGRVLGASDGFAAVSSKALMSSAK